MAKVGKLVSEDMVTRHVNSDSSEGAPDTVEKSWVRQEAKLLRLICNKSYLVCKGFCIHHTKAC